MCGFLVVVVLGFFGFFFVVVFMLGKRCSCIIRPTACGM